MPPPVAVASIEGNHRIQNGLKFTYIPSLLKVGQKVVQIDSIELKVECHKWEIP